MPVFFLPAEVPVFSLAFVFIPMAVPKPADNMSEVEWAPKGT